MASMLVNGARRESDKCNRLIVDEALMNHFGAIVMAGRISGAEEILLIGDVNQLPYIDRENLFEMIYRKPPQLCMNQNFVCTHRSPMDVAYALREIYPGIYSSKRTVRSLSMKDIKMTPVPGDLKYTLYLTFTQEEKESLIAQGWGGETGSKVLTIHESQGLTSATVIVVNTKSIRLQLHDSVSHAVVAISRHTDTCTYYSEGRDDAVKMLIRNATEVTTKRIVEYNLKMALKDRNAAVTSSTIAVMPLS